LIRAAPSGRTASAGERAHVADIRFPTGRSIGGYAHCAVAYRGRRRRRLSAWRRMHDLGTGVGLTATGVCSMAMNIRTPSEMALRWMQRCGECPAVVPGV